MSQGPDQPAAAPPLRSGAEALWQQLEPQLPGLTIEIVAQIASTNTTLLARARQSPADALVPALLVAEQQTAGRGRQGKTWHTGIGDALTFSLSLPLALRDWSGLSLAVGVSVAESLQPVLPALGSGHAARIGLKWPNDLWLGGAGGERKLGGILVETASFVTPQAAATPSAPGAPNTRYVVVGIGINVLPRSAEGLSMPPGSLQDVAAGLDAPTALLRIAAPLVAMLQSFEAYGFAPMQARFAARDVLQGRAVALSDGQAGTAHGVAEDGALLVHTAHGMQAITSAEISVRPAAARPL